MELERTIRRKIVESSVTGLTYHVLIESDFEQGFHLVQIYDQPPDAEPLEVKILGFLPVKLASPPVEPIMERTYPLHADLKQRIAELIYRHELPLIRLQELDAWDGWVEPPKRKPEPDAAHMEESTEEPMRNPEEAEQEDAERKRYVRVKHWNSNVITVYDRLTGRVWQEGEDTEDLEDVEEVS